MDLVTNLETFEKIPAMLVLIPVLLNIKGNIEANMSTRLSTLANMGVLDSPSQRKDIIFANLGLLLLQALLTSFAVTTTSGLISLIPLSKEADGAGDSATILPWFSGFTITVASGVSSALLGSTLIGSLVCAIVTLSSRFGINPDNVSNPIASGFGDMVTLFFLAGSSLLWLRYFVTQGWLPLLYAALTSSIAGLLMERYVEDLVGMASLLPVFNGIGGNIASVFASRLSTSLHRGDSNDKEEKRTLWTLLGLGIPIQLMFLGTVKLMGFAHGAITPVFVLVYIIASSIQVFSLLCLAKLGTKRLWAMSYDPDNYINPIITGTGDMLGTVLLVSVFLIV
ncbi:hypothetical protein H4219_000390 [Mycoemilia scoparia]|uniref:SLC41A/MgtE integral membrane domain-containing protein n=1 Tax=Mycoemilia scoparia TaxID=417184 RepID=A0A9W8DRS8_9FUNG|nr:hypothetical protein H4219_000390 [Mycoemilia scoparia]